MRFLWVDYNADPDWAKVTAHGMTGLFFDARSPNVNRDYLVGVNQLGYAVGLYFVDNWPEFDTPTGREFAEAVHAQMKLKCPNTNKDMPKIQFDIERHDPAFVAEALRRFRELRPTRDLSWTFEPRQQGWMTADLVQAVSDCKVRLVPQYYFGDMTPVAQDVEFNRTRAVFPTAAISGFYDAKILPVDWDGFAFIQGRLSSPNPPPPPPDNKTLAPLTYNAVPARNINGRYCIAGLQKDSSGAYTDGLARYDDGGRQLGGERSEKYVAGLKYADMMDGLGPCDPYEWQGRVFPPWPNESYEV